MSNINKYAKDTSRELMETVPVKLDLKDKKVLFELDFNARIPYSQLATKVGLSKQGTEYKVNNLIKKDVIRGFYPVINVAKLGYLYCRLSVTLQNVTKEKYNEIVAYLANHPQVFWMFKMQGPFDLFFASWQKSLTSFHEFIKSFENKFGEHIKEKNESLATDVIHYQHRYLLGIKETKAFHLKETDERILLDDLDKKILHELCKDARIPLINIANKVKESAKVVAYRIKKLEQKGIIEGYRPVINQSKIGYTYYKLFINLNNFSQNNLKKLKTYIKNNPHVIYIVEGINLGADLDIEIMVKSNQQLFDFIEDLKFTFPKLVGEYRTVIFMEVLKVVYLPF